MTMHVIRVEEYGTAEVLLYKEMPMPEPKPNKAVVKLQAIGVNFIDVYHRTGLYPLPLPFPLGQEGAGIVESVGAEVQDVKVGERVAFTDALAFIVKRQNRRQNNMEFLLHKDKEK